MSSFGSGFRKSGQRREADQHDFTQATLPGKQPVITSIIRDFSAEALSELRLWLEQNPPAIPIYQLPGFALTVPQRASVLTTETTTSVAVTDLATVGPRLTGLADGKYLILVSAVLLNSTAGEASLMGPAVNGVGPSDDVCAALRAAAANLPHATPVGMTVASLANAGNNTITARYRVTGGTGTFFYRNLVAIRLANP